MLSQKNEASFINDYWTDVLEEKTQAPKKGDKNVGHIITHVGQTGCRAYHHPCWPNRL
jgi:hypothetical protein